MTGIIIPVDDTLQPAGDLDPASRQDFLESMTGRAYDWQSNCYRQERETLLNTVPESPVYHRSYLGALATAWRLHLGIVLTPDILFYTVLCELAGLVKEYPEYFRDRWTNAADKVEIRVLTGDPRVIPLDLLREHLLQRIPACEGYDVEQLYLGEFSTTTSAAMRARITTFADMVSPYYNYSTYMCGIPYVRVLGTEEDWEQLFASMAGIEDHMRLGDSQAPAGARGWWNACITTVQDTAAALRGYNLEMWKDIFRLDRCGSGGELEVDGWWVRRLYRKVPPVRKLENWSSHVSKIQYKNLELDRTFELCQGCFSSQCTGLELIPEFSEIVQVVLTEPLVTPAGTRESRESRHNLQLY